MPDFQHYINEQNIIILFVAIVSLLLIVVYSAKKSLGYRKVTLFTDAEKNFLSYLDKAVGEQYRVFGKVRIGDIILPQQTSMKKNYLKHFYKVSSKHFDFVLVDKDTLYPVAVIELNDKSHNKLNRMDRDAFVERACKSANLPLVWIIARRTYKLTEIRDAIESRIADKK